MNARQNKANPIQNPLIEGSNAAFFYCQFLCLWNTWFDSDFAVVYENCFGFKSQANVLLIDPLRKPAWIKWVCQYCLFASYCFSELRSTIIAISPCFVPSSVKVVSALLVEKYWQLTDLSSGQKMATVTSTSC